MIQHTALSTYYSQIKDDSKLSCPIKFRDCQGLHHRNSAYILVKFYSFSFISIKEACHNERECKINLFVLLLIYFHNILQWAKQYKY